ncbi:hypothetical protein ABT024_05220 [Streptomyces sp. NPDC002812]|uniref:hypothetical protein n=1 Tax=Streptomyces sp. NPDC002812 TaxID=3154434 RepID=UPI003329416A
MSTHLALGLNAVAVLDATRTILGPDWATFPAHSGAFSGSIRSQQGHTVELDGAAHGLIFASALLPGGKRLTLSTTAKAMTPAAYGTALARLITGTLVPAHDARSRLAKTVGLVRDALDGRSSTTRWVHGTAHTRWDLPGGGRVLSEIRQDGASAGTERLDSTLRFAGPSIDQAAAVLRAISATTLYRPNSEPAYGPLAQQMKAAGPWLRPGTPFYWPNHGGLTTTLLTADNVARIEMQAREVVLITVTGPVENQLAAIRAV